MKKYKPEELALDGSVLPRMKAGNEGGDPAMDLIKKISTATGIR